MKPDNDDSLPSITRPGQAAWNPKVGGKLLITKHVSRVYGSGLAIRGCLDEEKSCRRPVILVVRSTSLHVGRSELQGISSC